MDLKVNKMVCKLRIGYTYGRALNKKKKVFQLNAIIFLINKCSKTL